MTVKDTSKNESQRIKTLDIKTNGESETRQLAEKLGWLLNDQCLITFSGTLGSGKTTFVQSMAKGLDVPPEYYVTSPTYTIINSYPGRLSLHHADLYRIEDEAELEEIGFQEMIDNRSVTAVEWPEKVSDSYLKKDIGIQLDVLNASERKIILHLYGLKFENLVSNLVNYCEDMGLEYCLT